MVLGDYDAECLLVHFIVTKMLKFCLKYPIGQLSKVSASALHSPSTVTVNWHWFSCGNVVEEFNAFNYNSYFNLVNANWL